MRTGIRSGLAPRRIVHLAGATKNGTRCGRKPAKWGPATRSTIEEARKLAPMDVEVCGACEARAS
ncbi:MAG: hypothetical protein BWZ09_02094 [Alphaproteobacteria bacterium ADurb.BinA305]|nr:MAG: hypothetical protein BWZ09_02094 [Alphaproteobacteria bacterium ADurb.BinA305]